MEDNESQSFDESKIQRLRRQFEVSKSQLIKLAYNDNKLLEKIAELNRLGYQSITKQQFYQAIVFLNEAQSVLEYAAGCGRTIDRTLIIVTLHNQACVYQRIWQLNKSSDYLEAIIYNISSFINSQPILLFNPDVTNHLSPQHQKLSAFLASKLQLISYNLQFCAVSSQIKNHQNALRSAQKSLTWLKSYCEELHTFQKLVNLRSQGDIHLLQELQSIRNFQNESLSEVDQNIQKLMYKAKRSISGFQKKLEFPPTGLSKQEQKQLQNFSLGQVMQVSPILVPKMLQRFNIFGELSLLKKIYKAIYISIAHFTMATELRLISNQRLGPDSNIRRLSKQFKQSQVHHLVAVITVALYVPCYTKYFEHILNSFKNHYQIDLSQMSQLSLSNEGNQSGDDLIHLEIQSVSQKDSELTNQKELSKNKGYLLPKESKSQKMGLSFQKQGSGHKTAQEIQQGSPQSSQNEYLRQLNRTVRSSQKKNFKKKPQKSKKKIAQHTSREKQTLIIEKVTSKSKSKNKKEQPQTKRSKSRKSVHQVQQKQRVIHYFHYDNYSKKVVKKKMKVNKDPSEYELTKNVAKPMKDSKSPEALINNHLKKLNKLTQSTKDLIATELAPKIKKGKSPELSNSKSQKHTHKK